MCICTQKSKHLHLSTVYGNLLCSNSSAPLVPPLVSSTAELQHPTIPSSVTSSLVHNGQFCPPLPAAFSWWWTVTFTVGSAQKLTPRFVLSVWEPCWGQSGTYTVEYVSQVEEVQAQVSDGCCYWSQTLRVKRPPPTHTPPHTSPLPLSSFLSHYAELSYVWVRSASHI